MAQTEDYQKKLITFLADKGFIYGPEPEIYQGIAGFYTYGPLGKSLKNKLEGAIKRVFTSYDFWEVECPTILPAIVWEASGHLGGFTDPLIRDEKNGIHRVDKLIAEWCLKHDVNVDSLKIEGATKEHLLAVLEKHNIVAPNGLKLVPKITDHSLMMRTTIGVETEAYNRPETATATYLPFLRYAQFFRSKTPFGVFQIGKAYRNEISPRQSVIRGREFTQAEGQLFILEHEKAQFARFERIKNEVLPFWSFTAQDKELGVQPQSLADAMTGGLLKNQAYAWSIYLAYTLFIEMGIPSDRIRLRQHNLDERAFYADDAWDIEIKFESYGWIEVCGVHDRTTYDLGQHSKFSKTDLLVVDSEGKKHMPHVIEIAFGVDRPLLALLDIFYKPAQKDDGKPSLSLPYRMAPVEVAVFPLVNKEEIVNFATTVYEEVQKQFISQYDKSGSIGKRYLRQDEVGTPFCITVDADSITNSDVTVRDRDTQKQERVKVAELVGYLHQKLR
jgi:glycyl-tRNA synthetase